ncbi:hypothetical protein EA462_13720 [Natrarchaeobius halalkaliphilus]|uniref:Tripartite tricarboxylate transporter substrate binding protein n=1 Tax=Natrarchaeobius halalkaliphilus TaxID=1679091 RepID=A0A3N6LIV4_9EURY|nr:tripartite tricarboxylate transporter substrate-binding protein [Natrarchaeobius halalkaliphilus]RQG87916.1 hypothetical protein EA462_13720 [Natrarchaeobius halalkaliphilus]
MVHDINQLGADSATSRRKVLALSGSAMAAGVAGCLGDDDGDDDDEEYPTGDIDVIIPFDTGTGFDTFVRGVIEFLPGHLPNEVDVIPDNQGPAPEGTAAIYNAEPDGYEIGASMLLGMSVQELMLDAPFSIAEMTALPRIHADRAILAANTDTPYETVDDLQTTDEDLRWAVVGGTDSHYQAVITADEMGIPADIVPYDGAPDAIASTLRGETEITAFSASSTPMADGLTQGDLRPVMIYNDGPLDYLPYTQELDIADTTHDLGYSELDITSVQRVFFAPPDLPDDIHGVLEDALMDTMESDEMQEWADEDEGRFVDPAPSDVIADEIDMIHDLINEHEDTIQEHLDD